MCGNCLVGLRIWSWLHSLAESGGICLAAQDSTMASCWTWKKSLPLITPCPWSVVVQRNTPETCGSLHRKPFRFPVSPAWANMSNPNVAEAGWSVQKCIFDPDKGPVIAIKGTGLGLTSSSPWTSLSCPEHGKWYLRSKNHSKESAGLLRRGSQLLSSVHSSKLCCVLSHKACLDLGYGAFQAALVPHPLWV